MEEINQLKNIATILIDFCVRYSFQIIGAIFILVVGFYIAGWLSRIIIRLCEKNNMDAILSSFFGQMVKIIVLCFVFIMALGKFGISVAPLIAALGAVAFGASLALQGPCHYHDTSLCGGGYDFY